MPAKYVAAVLISMAFVSPAMALTARPAPESRCLLFRASAEPQRALPANEVTAQRIGMPGERNFARIAVSILLRVLGCEAPRPQPK
jgi:hypothetical protein